jgi:hemolysin activation/secretion protein
MIGRGDLQDARETMVMSARNSVRKAPDRHRAWLASAALLLVPAVPAFGQVQPTVQAPQSPTREEIQRSRSVAPTQGAPTSLSVEGGIEREACPLAAPQYASGRVTFTQVRFNGLTVVDPAVLGDSWSDLAGTPQPVSTLCDIRDRAVTALRAMGYLAVVKLPPQRVEKDGVVNFDVLVAKLVSIRIRGRTGNSEQLIASLLEPLTKAPAFNVNEAERRLLLAGDLPGYDVRLVLRPANTVPGEVIGEINVRRQRVRLDINVQNLGSNEVGRWGGLARLQVNDITGLGDSTVISLFNTAQTREQTVLQLGHAMAIGTGGLRLSGNFTYAWSKPSVVGGKLRSETLIATTELTYPLVRRQATNLALAGGFDLVDQDVFFAGTKLTSDRIRVAYARADLEMTDPASITSTVGYAAAEPRWRLAASLELRKGLSVLGASNDCGPAPGYPACATVSLSHIEAQPNAFVARLVTSAEWRPLPQLAVVVSPRAQYSPDPLVSFEEFSGGNYTVGRGYDPGSIVGDSGVGVSAELRYGTLLPASRDDLALQPFVFLDYAKVWNHRSLIPGADGADLLSGGWGLRGNWGNRSRFEVTIAAPLRRTVSQQLLNQDRGDVRLLFSVTSLILPWGQ